MDEPLFLDKCPCGYCVSLSSQQYNVHILEESGHSITVNDIEKSITSPQIVYNSTYEFAPRMVYFAAGCNGRDNLFTKTITEIDDEKNGLAHVVTAFPTTRINGSIDVERGPVYVNITNQVR